MRHPVAIVAVSFSLLAGCSGKAADAPSPSAERSVEALVTFEAEWQCERERHAFDQLEDLAERLAATREAAGISADTYAAFQAELAEDAALRLDVLAAYRAECA